MSTDLNGWYIATNKNTQYNTAKYSLEVLGANHSWSGGGFDSPENIDKPRWWNADTTHTFMEQVNLVVERCRSWAAEGSIEYFLYRAKELEEQSITLNKPIKSYWI